MSTEIKADVVGSEAGSAETKRDANTWSVEEGHDDALVDEEPRKVKKTKMTEGEMSLVVSRRCSTPPRLQSPKFPQSFPTPTSTDKVMLCSRHHDLG